MKVAPDISADAVDVESSGVELSDAALDALASILVDSVLQLEAAK